MNVSQLIKDYTFAITPEKIEPILSEPVVQAFLSAVSHITAALMMFQRFIELAKLLRLSDFVMKLVRLYMPA